MKTSKRIPGGVGRRHGCLFMVITLALALSTYIEQVMSLPVETPDNWPTFPRRNIAALARAGYLRVPSSGYKRSISTLAKNGQLPTFRSPYDETDKQEHDEEESHDKRNVGSIARLRSFSALKRNVQALARDGYRPGRQSGQQNDKRNLASLAKNGMIHKRDGLGGDEYYYPFYQNPIPPLSEIDGPFDVNEIYDYQQSVNPDMFPPLSKVYKRSKLVSEDDFVTDEGFINHNMNEDDDLYQYQSIPLYLKRGIYGMPAHGVYRPTYTDPAARSKRYILSIPDVVDSNNVHVPEEDDSGNDDKRSVDETEEVRENYEKRHIGSLARLGLLPSFRFTGGRYSRSGRTRLLWPSQGLYRKHSADENFGIRQYFTNPEVEPAINPDNSDLQTPSVPSYSHPTGRIFNRPPPLNNDLPHYSPSPPMPPPTDYTEAITRNRWQSEKPKFYYFRSLKVPHHTTGKRYLIYPGANNVVQGNYYPNNSLPSRRKNQ